MDASTESVIDRLWRPLPTWVLGPGVNDGPADGPPTADALRERLVERGDRRVERTHAGLIDVAEDYALKFGPAALYEVLRDALAGDFPLAPLHRFLARVPSLARENDGPPPPLLIVDLNLDRALERAFEEVTEPYDVVTYQASGPHHG